MERAESSVMSQELLGQALLEAHLAHIFLSFENCGRLRHGPLKDICLLVPELVIIIFYDKQGRGDRFFRRDLR